MKKILLLGSQHGNELLGEKLFAYIRSFRKELVPFVIFKVGNPEAYRNGIRYLETDMNRAYVPNPVSYEEHLANDMLSYIHREDFDLVLDLHTTRTIQPPSFIHGQISDEVKRFIKSSTIKHVVYMNDSIVKRSLIGNCNHALSIEVQNTNLSVELYEALCDDIQRYVRDKKISAQRYYYEITELLLKNELSETQLKTLINFKKSAYGFYPVLVGENSYKKQTNYLGFKAQRVTTLRGSTL